MARATCILRTARLVHLGLLLAFAGRALCQQQVSSSSDPIQLLRNGENQQALEVVERILKAHPEDCRLLALKGMALNGLGQMPPALRAFEQSVSHCTAYLPSLEGAAQIEYAQHSPKAVATLQQILVVQPDNVTAHAMLASVYRRRGNCVQALPHYEASRALFESRPELLDGYGSCLARSGEYTAALPVYQKLLKWDESERVRYDVAVLQWKTGQTAAAMDTLAPLLNAGAYEPALALGSRLAEATGDTPRAVALLRQAIMLDPTRVDNYLDFAAIAFNHKSFQVGIDVLNTGLAKLPNVALMYIARGVLEVQLTRNDAAIADFERARRLAPGQSLSEDAMGVMQSQLHHDAQSLALLRTAARQYPHDALLQYLLAEQLANAASEETAANQKDAIQAATESAKLDPSYQPAHDLLARLYVETGQKELAIQQAELALANNPNDAVALYQEMMAKRGVASREEMRTLTARLQAARAASAKDEASANRYRLEDSTASN